MSLLTILGLAAAGAAGAICRVALARTVISWQATRRRSGTRLSAALPVGTLMVNLVGAFAAGVLAGWAQGPLHGDPARSDPDLALMWVLGVGFLGAFTTFSTWMVESWRHLASASGRSAGLLHLVIAVVLGVALAMAGLALGTRLAGGG